MNNKFFQTRTRLEPRRIKHYIKLMKKIILTIFSCLFICTNLYALPKCPGEKRDLSTWKNCNGSYTAMDGHSYSGDFDSNGQYSGYGKLKNNQSIYEGEFLKDKYHGKGTQTLLNESGGVKGTYVGEFFMGSWNGKGLLKSSDGSFIYDGEFQNYEMTGYGTLTINGQSKTGNFKNGNLID